MRSFLLGLWLGILSCSDSRGERSAGGAVDPESPILLSVGIAGVSSRTMSPHYDTSAVLEAERRATLVAQAAGPVAEVVAEEGDEVRAGAVLARLDAREQRVRLEQARSELRSQERELERQRQLATVNATGVATVEALVDAVERARQSADLAELAHERTTIRAPWAGTILARRVVVGQTVAAGAELFEIASTAERIAHVAVPAKYVAGISVDQKVDIMSSAPELRAEGTVLRVAPAVDAQSGTVQVTVRMQGPEALRVGTFVRVSLEVGQRVQAVVVPSSAIVTDGLRHYVFRLDLETDTVTRLEVETGLEDGEVVQVAHTLGEGAPIAEGDTVVVAGATVLGDGVRVKPVKGP